MDEIFAVIIFGAYAAFVIELNIEGKIPLRYKPLEFIVLALLFGVSGYFGIKGLVKLDILDIVISNIALWSMKLFKL